MPWDLIGTWSCHHLSSFFLSSHEELRKPLSTMWKNHVETMASTSFEWKTSSFSPLKWSKMLVLGQTNHGSSSFSPLKCLSWGKRYIYPMFMAQLGENLLSHPILRKRSQSNGNGKSHRKPSIQWEFLTGNPSINGGNSSHVWWHIPDISRWYVYLYSAMSANEDFAMLSLASRACV